METYKAHKGFLSGQGQVVSTNNGDDPLASGATVYSDVVDLGPFTGPVPAQPGIRNAGRFAPDYFRASASSDVAGVVGVQCSYDGDPDGANWWNITSEDIVADFTQITVVDGLLPMRYVRGFVTNGGSDQTDFEFDVAVVSL